MPAWDVNANCPESFSSQQLPAVTWREEDCREEPVRIRNLEMANLLQKQKRVFAAAISRASRLPGHPPECVLLVK